MTNGFPTVSAAHGMKVVIIDNYDDNDGDDDDYDDDEGDDDNDDYDYNGLPTVSAAQ